MASNLTAQVREIARVTTAVAQGDLTKSVNIEVKGEIRELKDTINTMVDQLSSFAAEVTRVAREVGTEGKLGGQAEVRGVAGTWKDLTDSVNWMARNLTSQVRGIAKVVTAVANGDLTRKLAVDAKGEIAALADTINGMIDTLATFADQVTTMAREVGVEGKLGGQAKVPGAAGTWKDLTDNVNQLAENLTTQVRAIAEVATAVTKGDLTRSITVEAQGEVAALKDNINEMIRNLKDTTQKNSEQDWLKTNLAKFSRMLQGQRDLLTVGKLILSELVPVVSAQQALFYTMTGGKEDGSLQLLASYAGPESVKTRLRVGEGLAGQCAAERQRILLTRVPPDYLKVSSGLGESAPAAIVVLPVLFEGVVKAVLELASFEHFSPTHLALLDQLVESIGIVLNTIEANTLTEDLLKQSQSLASELQSQQEELRQTNQELEDKARLLAEQNVEVERKNTEVEQARQALEEKAKQLALTSKFKSEFLANMSHELRTPLNSLLILSDQLSRNPDGNLNARQTQFARTIHAAGNDLLTLINDILDLSKIESGTVAVDIEEYSLLELRDYVERTFRHVAESKKLDFVIDLAPAVPRGILTDPKRLQQVLKNLLSNAFKFTDAGHVELRIAPATSGWSTEAEGLVRAKTVIAISVTDTGIGIPEEKQRIIFEAFQQADGSTSRKFGGTGLGLAISRELSRLLGGELCVSSMVNHGSTFTLYLPHEHVPRRKPAVAPETIAAPAPREEDREPLAEMPPVAVDLQADDRETIQPGDRTLLIVENDAGFAQFLLDTAREQGFKGVVTAFGAAALARAVEHPPDAITLDLRLPDVDGFRVLARLKSELATRHIPVYVVSTEEERARCLEFGALDLLAKPVKNKESLERVLSRLRAHIERPEKRLLLVATEPVERETVVRLLAHRDIGLHAAGSWEEALDALGTDPGFDCLAIAGRSRPLPGARLDAALAAFPGLPVVVCATTSGADPEEDVLRHIAHERSVKLVYSHERLFDETARHLHRRVDALPPDKRRLLRSLHETDAVLAGKSALIVDDDVRNIFAMTSVLEQHRMSVMAAENGRDAIELLRGNPAIDIVLMDIMMPEMDGYDTIRAIREIPAFGRLPIVAVTAKAMKGDREKCIEAGAWDYLSKPVDSVQMLSICRSWLLR
jgi:signal transduction histidine kinase/DNA-binding response OmpR family regulator/HAMP domain-containing protein